MSRPIRVVQFVNQFFAQIGGEEKAGMPPQIVEGAVGPARATAQILGSGGSVAATLVCGDNYAAEQTEAAMRSMLELLRPFEPDLVLAGPAFNAGRYGVACGAICRAVQMQLGIPAITGMSAENPGVDLYRRGLYIVETGASATEMFAALTKMVGLGRKLVHGEPIGKPKEEGYFPRGITRNELAAQTAAERATTMLLAKLRGQPFETEMPIPQFERITPPARVADLRRAKVALVTDGGLVPKGNPDGIEPLAATKYGAYDISDKDALPSAEYDNVHRGYDTTYVKQDPNRLIPLDVARELEKEGVIGTLHNVVFSTTGVATTLENSRRMGREIAAKLKAAGVDAVILTSTWGTSTRCGAAITKELERAGLPTVQVSTMTPVSVMVGANRIIPAAGIIHPVGNADLPPAEEKKLRRRIIEQALGALQAEVDGPTVFPSPRE